jgi:hypothetical protein
MQDNVAHMHTILLASQRASIVDSPAFEPSARNAK